MWPNHTFILVGAFFPIIFLPASCLLPDIPMLTISCVLVHIFLDGCIVINQHTHTHTRVGGFEVTVATLTAYYTHYFVSCLSHSSQLGKIPFIHVKWQCNSSRCGIYRNVFKDTLLINVYFVSKCFATMNKKLSGFWTQVGIRTPWEALPHTDTYQSAQGSGLRRTGWRGRGTQESGF